MKSIQERFNEKIEKTNTCWLWSGARTRDGYGCINVNGKNLRSHRFSYELKNGKIPEGLNIDHLCRNRACVNPDHLEAVTSKENILRGIGMAAINSRKTHCKRGHLLNEENCWGFENGRGRECKTCHRELSRERSNQYYWRKKWAKQLAP